MLYDLALSAYLADQGFRDCQEIAGPDRRPWFPYTYYRCTDADGRLVLMLRPRNPFQVIHGLRWTGLPVRTLPGGRKAARVIVAPPLVDPEPASQAVLEAKRFEKTSRDQLAPYLARLRSEGRPTRAEVDAAHLAMTRPKREKEERRRRQARRERIYLYIGLTLVLLAVASWLLAS